MSSTINAHRSGTLPIEVILTSPFFWKSTHLENFLLNSNASIHENKSSACIDFKASLEQPIPNFSFWGNKANWKDVLGRNYDRVITIFENDGKKRKIPGNVRTTSTEELLNKIRNRTQHNKNFKNAERKKLGWYKTTVTNGTRECVFNKTLFLNFWIKRFPEFFIFLWLKFKQFEESLKDFYPYDFPPYSDPMFLDILHLPRNLEKILQEQLEKGMMEARYSINNPTRTLEFMAMDSGVLARMLDKSRYLLICLVSGRISCKWYDSLEPPQGNHTQFNTQIDERLTKLRYSRGTVSQKIFILVADCIASVSETDKNALINFIAKNNECNRFIMFSTSRELQDHIKLTKIALLVDNQTEKNPVNWNDLRDAAKSRVINSEINGIVKSGPKAVTLDKILPDDGNNQNRLLSHLKGKLLNNLLSGKEADILISLDIPIVCNLYVARRLRQRVFVGKEIFSQSDTFIVTNIETQKAKQMIQDFDFVEADKYDITELTSEPNSHSTIYVTKYCLSEENIDFGESSNTHFLRYSHDSLFEWIKTVGSTDCFRNQCSDIERFGKWAYEHDFASHIFSVQHQFRCIMITGEPGMGKSEVLSKLSEITLSHFPRQIALYQTFNNFLRGFKVSTANKDKIADQIVNLASSNKFEQELVLQCIAGRGKFRVNLMLDALDEVPSEDKDLAFKLLSIVQNEFPSVLLWVTTRDHMLKELPKNFNHTQTLLKPFSIPVQKAFLKNYWASQVQQGNTLPPDLQLEEFIDMCINNLSKLKASQIAGTPLLCRLIAEKYESNVLKNDLESVKNQGFTLSSLYGHMIDKVIKRHLQEKFRYDDFQMKMVGGKQFWKMERQHTYFAIKLIVSEEDANLFSKHLLGFHPSDCIAEEIVSQGLIQNNPLTFYHRTFAEFLIARFICKVWTENTHAYSHISSDDPIFRKFLFKYYLGPLGIPHLKTVSDFVDEMLLEMKLIDKEILALYKTANVHRFFDNKEFAYNSSDIMHANSNIACLLVKQIKYFAEGMFFHYLELRPGSYQDTIACLKYFIEHIEQFGPENWHNLTDPTTGFSVLHFFIQKMIKYNELDLSFLGWVIQQNPSVLEKKCSEGNTPLLFVMKYYEFYRSFEHAVETVVGIVKFLVSKDGTKASIYATDNDGNGALHCSHLLSFDCHVYMKIIKLVVEHDKDNRLINSKNMNGGTPLMSAAVHFNKSWVEVVELFCKLSADFGVTDNQGNTVLHLLLEHSKYYDCLPTFQKLAECGADILAVNNNEESVLQVAVKHAKFSVVGWLTTQHPELACYTVNSFAKYSNTISLIIKVDKTWLEDAFCECLQQFDGSDLAKFLIKYFVENSTTLGLQDWHLLTREVNAQRLGVLHLLLHENFSRKTVLDIPFTEWIAQQNPSLVEQRNGRGETPLLFLLKSATSRWSEEHWAIIEQFVCSENLKPNIYTTDKNGNSVLHVLAKNIFNIDISTAIKFFVERDLKERLIKCKNHEGQTPLLRFAAHAYDSDSHSDLILETFREAKADFSDSDKNGNTALHLYMTTEGRSGYNICKSFIIQMIKNGADISAKNKREATFLHIAVHQRVDEEIVEWLGKEYPDLLNCRDDNGKTALEYYNYTFDTNEGTDTDATDVD